MAINSFAGSRASAEFVDPCDLDRRMSMLISTASTSFDHFMPPERTVFGNWQPPTSLRRVRAARRESHELEKAKAFRYPSFAGRDSIRLISLTAGADDEPIRCHLNLLPIQKKHLHYKCLSYCWGPPTCDHFILIRKGGEYCKFSVTENLHTALKVLRNRKHSLSIWIDQICINQADEKEKEIQLELLHKIFHQAREVIIWLGEEADRSDQLCEYAKKQRRGGFDTRKAELGRILTSRQVQDALQSLLLRDWFSRVWVIGETVLAKRVTIQCGRSQMSWDSLVKLVRDMPTANSTGFDKQFSLLGNKRQRIGLMAQMRQQNELADGRMAEMQRPESDITQFLVMAKASEATIIHDKIYAFKNMTTIATPVNYAEEPEKLYTDAIKKHIIAIQTGGGHSNETEAIRLAREAFQLTSILYSAGKLSQRLPGLPSWAPDWTAAWNLAPLWCRPSSCIEKGQGRNKQTPLRGNFRAGGDELKTFKLQSFHGFSGLLLSVISLDTIVSVTEISPPPTPALSSSSLLSEPVTESSYVLSTPEIRYGRVCFETRQGYQGLASPGIEPSDAVAIILGGDVPVILRHRPLPRPSSTQDGGLETYELLCDCLIESADVMSGGIVWQSMRDGLDQVQDVVLV